MNRRRIIMLTLSTAILIGGGVSRPPPALAQPAGCEDPLNSILPFTPAAERLFPASARGVAIACDDLNVDGTLDVVTLHDDFDDPGMLQVHLNTCVGDYFSPVLDFENIPATPVAMRVCDVGGGDAPDVVILCQAPDIAPPTAHRVHIRINDGTADLTAATTIDLSAGTAGGYEARGLDCADLDEDGDNDILCAARTSGNKYRAWIVWNDAGSSFDVDTFALAFEPRRVLCVDLADVEQSDPDPDWTGTDVVFVDNFGAARVFLNRGATAGGSHSTRFTFSGNGDDQTRAFGDPTGVVAGRLNDDEDEPEFLDLAHSRQGNSNQIRVLLNRFPVDECDIVAGTAGGALPGCDTGGVLQGVSVFSVGGDPAGMAAGDLSADGFDELVTANSGDPHGLSILLNLTEASTNRAFGGFERLQGQHVDGDAAYDDFFAYGEDGLKAVALGDINDDGCLDVVSLPDSGYYRNFSVFFGDCTGRVLTQYVYRPLERLPADVKCGHLGGDVNTNTGEEMVDIVVGNHQHDSNIHVWQQRWDGENERYFVHVQDVPAATASEPSFDGAVNKVAVFDFDQQEFTGGKFFDDVAVCLGEEPGVGLTASQVLVFAAAGDGTLDPEPLWDSGTSFDGENLQSLDGGDIDQDGDIDLAVVAGDTDRLYILTNDGTGQFTIGSPITVGDSPIDVVFCDVNGDGWMDVAVANRVSATVSVLINSGGSLNTPATYNVGEIPLSIACGNFDGNEFADLVIANNQDETISVLLFDETGLASNTVYDAAESPTSVGTLDANADCLDDIVVLNADGDNSPPGILPLATSVYLNDLDSPGTFHDDKRVQMPCGGDPAAVTTCDLDDNGRPDIIDVEGFDNGRIRITYNLCRQRGDFTEDCGLCGLDIQPFVNTYFFFTGQDVGGPANPGWVDPTLDDFVRADLDDNGMLDEDDVACFVNALLELPSCLCIPEGEQSPGLGGSGSQSTQGSQASTGPSLDPELQEAIDAVLAWLAENPKSAHPELTDQEYVDLLIDVMIDAGLIEPQEE